MFLAGCGGNKPVTQEGEGQSPEKSEDKGSVKIGVLLAQTGPFAKLSEEVKFALELYLEQSGNKLGGREVEVIYEDSEANPQVALRKFRQLVMNQKVDVVIGPESSSVLYALRDEIDKQKVLTLGPITAGNEISWEQKTDYFYRFNFSNWQGSNALGVYSPEHLGKKAIVVVSDYPGGTEGELGFRKEFEAKGGEVVETFRPALGEKDFAAYLNQMAQLEADFIFSFILGSDAVRFTKQMDEMGLKGKFKLTSPFSFGEEPFMKAAGASSEGLLSAVVYHPWIDNEKNKQFVSAYEEKYGEKPTQQSVAGYDIAQALDMAIEKTNSVEADDLRAVLDGITIDSPRGTFTLDPETNNPIQDIYIVDTVKEGDGLILKTLETYEQVQMPHESIH